jgi:hypothetical protein
MRDGQRSVRRNVSREIFAAMLVLLCALSTSGCGEASGTSAIKASGTATGMITGAPAGAGNSTSGATTGSAASAKGTGNVPAVAASATLSWMPPATNSDGSALTNLAGYFIRYGTDSSNLDTVINVPTVGLTTFIIENLRPGTYYFSLTSYNSLGVESPQSGIVSETI